MVKDEILTVKDAVYRLQLYLLEGINDENQLLAAGSLISQSDYKDVVTERTIANMCGYPLCNNLLPSERPSKGNYRISLKEHKVYDLQETYMYCSSTCLINSRAFAGSLQENRSSTLNPAKLYGILKVFDGSTVESAVNLGKNGDLGLSGLKIQEKTDIKSGEVSLEKWIGPSNAIDGYVPQKRDRKPQTSNKIQNRASQKQVESKQNDAQSSVTGSTSNDWDFTSTIIITQDEYSISKTVPPVKAKESKQKVNKDEHKTVASNSDKLSALSDTPGACQNDVKANATKAGKELCSGKEFDNGSTLMNSSLKTLDSKKATRSVTWVDETNDFDRQNLCKVRELEDTSRVLNKSNAADKEVSEESYRFESAEAIARALSQASEAVASGRSDVSDAVSEAGVVILPPSHGVDGIKSQEYDDVIETDPPRTKWPPKPGFSEADLLESYALWFDSPPEEFKLTLSSFSTMFMALFSWTSSTSLAYIYGRDECYHEEYLSVNGKDYPRKIVMPDGRSSEIKQTLASCLARALPGLVAELNLSVPISILEKGMGRLLETMSFTDPLPAFKIKQWQVIVLLFLDALSVSRIPALTPYLVGRRILPFKILEGAQISTEEYEILKDVILPLGRVPQFSSQSGG